MKEKIEKFLFMFALTIALGSTAFIVKAFVDFIEKGTF